MKLYTTKDHAGCKTIEETLHQMSLAYEVVDAERVTDILREEDLPVLIDGHETFVGTEKILKHLAKLRQLQNH